MLQRPWFKPHLTVRVVEDEGVLFLTETDHFSLQGKLYEMVASVIDGERTTSQIVNQLHGKASEKEVQETISELGKRGLLIESTNSIPANEAAFWWMQDIDPQTTLQRFENDSLSIQTFGKISVEPFVEAIRSFGIRIADEGRFGVVLTDDYLSSGLADYNDQSLNGDRSWMLIKPVGCEIWIGPLFVPGRTGCWECLAYRLRSNRNAETFLRFHKNQSQRESLVVSTAFTPVTLNIAWNLAAARVAKWIVQEELPELEGQIFVQKILTGESDIHKMVWRPQCPACGDPVEEVPQEIQPLVLQSTKKIFTVDGGHRVTTPEVTLEKYEHHISPITGIVKKMDRYGVTKAGALHVYGGSVNCVIGYEGIKSINDVMTSSGKGASDAQARTSALCESLERYSGIFTGEEPQRKSKLKDLGELAIHPNDLLHYSENQYRNRDLWNANRSTKMFVPQRFDEEMEIDWSPVWSLTQKRTRFVPTSYCYYFYPIDPERAFCNAHSNGNAAGNTVEEAILQGFFELVERDAVGIWWYNRIRRPLVDWTTFDVPYLEELQQYHIEHHREIWVLDITSDLQIPTFAAVSRRTDGPQEKIIVGFGAHLDAKIALLRAMTELNQGMVWTSEISHHSHSHPSQKYYESLSMDVSLDTVTSKDLPHVVPDTSTIPKRSSDYSTHWSDDIKEDVLVCKEIVENQSLEMLILDQTRPDVGLPVVKVMVPGLRHFWPRFAPGRLYDVPVKLGWLSEPLKEEQLNPIMVFS